MNSKLILFVHSLYRQLYLTAVDASVDDKHTYT